MIHGIDDVRVGPMLDSIRDGQTLFALVLSYTHTAEIPNITVAGADQDFIKYTPLADAEYIEYGHCKCIDAIPTTPDGKPTPAVLTRAALMSAQIPHIAIDAGGLASPDVPHIRTGLSPGNNILHDMAMDVPAARRAIEMGRMTGSKLGALCDCIIIGESIPGGTTTALATLSGLNLPGPVSSSMPKNPVRLKGEVVRAALDRLNMDDPITVAAKVSDPMILYVCGMLNGASRTSHVILAGGTQMLAVLALAAKVGFDHTHTALATTSYIADDESVRFVQRADTIASVPVLWTDPLLEKSRHGGLQAYAAGFAKEGAGAGGAMVAARIKTGMSDHDMLQAIDTEYDQLAVRHT